MKKIIYVLVLPLAIGSGLALPIAKSKMKP
jgi:hypothetical protein